MQPPPKLQLNPWYKTIGKTWRPDLIAGITVWGLVVPEAMAYTGLAGVPAQAGIYTIVFVVGMYALFGTSRQLVASATSASAATVGGIIASLSEKPEVAVGAVALGVGVIYLGSGMLRLGFIVRFISIPIHAGFMFGLALFITISQVPKVLGLEKISGNAFQRFVEIIAHVGDIKGWTLLVGAVALVLLFALERFLPRIPGGLLVVLGGILATNAFDLNDKGVKVVGKVPSGLPSLSWPDISASSWLAIFTASFGVVLIGLSEAISVAEGIAERHGYRCEPNRDMMAFGIGNITAGFFGGLVGAGSMSSSSLNERSGAKSQFSGLVAAMMALATLMWFSGVLTDLPEAILGALVIHAVANHLRASTVWRIRKFSTAEFYVALLALVGVLIFDVLAGLLLAMLANLVYYVYRTVTVKVSVDFKDSRGDDDLELEVDGLIFYASAPSVKEQIEDAVSKVTSDTGAQPKTVHLRLSGQSDIDLTTASMLDDLANKLEDDGTELHLVNERTNVERKLGHVEEAAPSHEG